MPAWLTGIGAKLAAFGALLLGILIAVARLIHKGEVAGQTAVVAKDQAATLDTVEKAHAAQAKVEALPTAKIDEGLREWTRD